MKLVVGGAVAVAAGRTDAACLAACSQGEAAALGALFDRHHAGVRRFVAGMACVDASDLDDIVQTTFIAVWQAAKHYRGDAQVRTWLFGIAHNVVRHHVRSAARRRVLSLAFLRNPTLPSGPRAVDEAMSAKQQHEQLRAALAALPFDLRTAFVLCDIEGFSGVDAAAVLSVPPGTLWRRLHTARQKLRVALWSEGGA